MMSIIFVLTCSLTRGLAPYDVIGDSWKIVLQIIYFYYFFFKVQSFFLSNISVICSYKLFIINKDYWTSKIMRNIFCWILNINLSLKKLYFFTSTNQVKFWRIRRPRKDPFFVLNKRKTRDDLSVEIIIFINIVKWKNCADRVLETPL